MGLHVSAENRRMLWIPAGFAHGFLALSEFAEVLYKATDYYAPEHERCILWSDPGIGVDWPLTGAPLVSDKDASGRRLAEAETYA
jgi:dTDP-4-dehydrorhamnose 3,5-epimerase